MKLKNYSVVMVLLSLIVIQVFFNKSKYGALVGTLLPLLMVFFACAVLKRVLALGDRAFVIKKESIICLGLLAINVVSSYFSRNVQYVVFSELFSLAALVLFYFILLNNKISADDAELFIQVYSLSAVIVSLCIIFNFLTGNYYVDNRASFEFVGVYKDPNYVSALLTPAICLCAWKGNHVYKIIKRLFWYGCTAVVLMGVVLTGSRAAFLAIVGAVIVYLAFEVVRMDVPTAKKIGIFIVVAMAGIGVIYYIMSNDMARLFDIQTYQDDIRLVIWMDALSFFKGNVLLGNGISSTSQFTVSRWYGLPTHNCFLDMLGDSGILGAGCMVALIVNNIKKSNNKQMSCVLTALALIPLASINGYYTMHFWIALAILYVSRTLFYANSRTKNELSHCN